jgi:nicotinamidase-related amidase
MKDYLSPERGRAALLTIDMQRDFVKSAGAGKPAGAAGIVPAAARLAQAFRAAGSPIVHVVRLYRPDGSNADISRRAAIEEGSRIAMPGSLGAELVDELKPRADIRLEAEHLLEGKPQQIGPREWILYKPRWGAFYQTRLEEQLRALGVSTVVICGCNFAQCARASVMQASERDFRIVLITDATAGTHETGLCELGRIGVYLMTSDHCVAWMTQGKAVA